MIALKSKQQKERKEMSKTTTDNNKKATDNKKATQSLTDVSVVLNKLNIDNKKYYVVRCYDVEEFSEVEVIRKSYACIKERISNRVIVKLWGHKDFVTCECSKMLRKKEEIDVTKKLYTEKELDKNNNYKCYTVATATALTNDFLSQVDKYLCKLATATEKKEAKKEAK